MKQTLGTYFSCYFKMPKLFRDDLEGIEQIIKKDLKCQAYHIAFNGKEYDAIADIPETAGQTSTLVLYTHQPCFRLKFARSWSELYAGDAGSDESRAALDRICAIITRTERPRLYVFSKLASWLAPVFTFAALAEGPLLIFVGWIPRQVGINGIIGITLAGIIWWIVGRQYSTNHFCYLDLQNRRSQTSP